MFSFPPPLLGDVSACTIVAQDLEASLEYYKLLGFRELHRATFPFAWIQISDGAVLIMLREGTQPYIALTYYVRNMDELVDSLRAKDIVVQAVPTPDKMVQRFVIKTEEEHLLSLVTYFDGFSQPPGPTLLTMSPSDYTNPDRYPNPVCGVFGEYALPVRNLENSIRFWEKLGMKTLSKRNAPYPWAILSDGVSIIGLHQSTAFDSPRLTYFASQRSSSIDALVEQGVSGITRSDAANCVVKTPEGQYLNLYSF